MPRSYSFDHYQAVNPIGEKEGRFGLEKHKQKIHDQEEPTAEKPAHGHAEVHYGKKFSQTEEILQARKMEHELEELAGIGGEEGAGAAKEARPQARQMKQSSMREAQQAKAHRGQPIGALPATDEAMPQTRFGDLFDDASRQAKTLVLAARDLTRASARLLLLPVRTVQLAARRMRPRHA